MNGCNTLVPGLVPCDRKSPRIIGLVLLLTASTTWIGSQCFKPTYVLKSLLVALSQPMRINPSTVIGGMSKRSLPVDVASYLGTKPWMSLVDLVGQTNFINIPECLILVEHGPIVKDGTIDQEPVVFVVVTTGGAPRCYARNTGPTFCLKALRISNRLGGCTVDGHCPYPTTPEWKLLHTVGGASFCERTIPMVSKMSDNGQDQSPNHSSKRGPADASAFIRRATTGHTKLITEC